MGTKFDSIYHRDRPLWQREEPERERAALEFRSEPRARDPTARAPDALRVGVASPTRTRTKASEREIENENENEAKGFRDIERSKTSCACEKIATFDESKVRV